MKTRNVGARLATAVIFLASAVAELVRVALDRPWPSFVPAFSHVMSVLLAALWLATALLAGLGSKKALYLPMYATMMLAAWGIAARAAGAKEAIVYIVLAPVVIVLERFAFAAPVPGRVEVFRAPSPPDVARAGG